MTRSSRLPSSMATLHNTSRVNLIFTKVLPIRDSEKVFITGWRYSLHILSTLPKIYHGLLHISLLCTQNESYTPWNYYFHEKIYVFFFFYLVLYLQLVGILNQLKKAILPCNHHLVENVWLLLLGKQNVSLLCLLFHSIV